MTTEAIPSPYARRVLAALGRDPTRVVLHRPDTTVTAGALRASVLGSAALLHSQGIRPGTTVAILTGPNHPLMLSARYAVHLLGATSVYVRSMNPRTDTETFSVATQTGLLRDLGVSLLLVDEADEESAARGRWLARRRPGLTVRAIPRTADGHDTVPPALSPSPDDLAVVDFTSGSTGRPKMVAQRYGTREHLVGRLASGLDPRGPATLLSVTPVSHTTAPMADAVLCAGGTVVLHDEFDADATLTAIAELGVTDVYLAVPHLYRLLDHPLVTSYDLSSLRRITYSGTPAAPERVRQAVRVFGDVLIQVYGTTEAGGISSLTPLDHREPELLGSAGRPFPWVRVEIREPDSGTPLGRGRSGEIWINSPTVSAGYLDDAELTAATYRDGWLRTGDLGHWDRYGYLRLDGRVGDVIKHGGLKLDPSAIEAALLKHPQVRQAAVFGVRDEDLVEQVHAAVELHSGAGHTSCDLRDYVAATLTPEHAPLSVSIWPELPLTPTGKPDRTRLRGATAPIRIRPTPKTPRTEPRPPTEATTPLPSPGDPVPLPSPGDPVPLPSAGGPVPPPSTGDRVPPLPADGSASLPSPGGPVPVPLAGGPVPAPRADGVAPLLPESGPAPPSPAGGPAPSPSAGGRVPRLPAGGSVPLPPAGGPVPPPLAGGPVPLPRADGVAPPLPESGPAPSPSAGGPVPPLTVGGSVPLPSPGGPVPVPLAGG
ncbi:MULTISPECIES: fatty acid--CoA ligase family protein, partial [Streptomyces]|uniref:class I adenylate-forming enzyme family protein n=1 Tax=Streptomyces TaxID=1883 RepID=UPI000262F9DB